MYKKIRDYGVTGNLHTVALVGIDGSIDWLCLPYTDSPSVFGALLDDSKGGRFSISPLGEWNSSAEYITDTNILVTKFRTKTGVLSITDFMPVPASGMDAGDKESHELYRMVEVLDGRVEVSALFEPRFDYARGRTEISQNEHGILASQGEESLFLSTTHELNVFDGKAEGIWELNEGEKAWLHLVYCGGELCRLRENEAEKVLEDTREFWRTWLRKSETGRTLSPGPFSTMLNRSALVLKLLYFNPTGALAAAATTSLPESIGGERNWDYRYCWVRDSSFTLQALFDLGHLTETEGYLRWIEKLLKEHGIQIMYGLRGEEDLPEQELNHLEGYRGSRPVRIGNAAAGQKQLDIYGELMDAALKLSDYVGKVDVKLWPFLRALCEHVVDHWAEPDSGIWEIRGGPYHFVYSKVMCWVALDRGLVIARRYGFEADFEKWKRVLDEIKEEVLNKGWNENKGAFVQHYDTDALDSSNLLIPIMGFLPFDDPRVTRNLEATMSELSENGFLYRYLADDGLKGKEGTFLLCTFWLIDNLVGMGRLDGAEAHIHKMRDVANHLGLFSEEYDTMQHEQLGNFPQAFTHIGYINSVVSLIRAREKAAPPEESEGISRLRAWLSSEIVLNEGETSASMSPHETALMLKTRMNVLRGAFFDTKRGRVAYERMNGSDAYDDYVRLSRALKYMDLSGLKNREEEISFWINLYNVLVIHGVVELGMRDSVKEVRGFFRRVKYNIGDMLFSPDDMEHGILRGNRRPPGSLFRPFGSGDNRLDFSIEPMDPRIHFALVCASSSCPPIGVYTAEGLDEELDIAGKTFLNSGGFLIDRDEGKVSLSRVFKWYGGDFGESLPEVLRSLAEYLYDEDERQYVLEYAESLKVTYQSYDWRLNRY